MKDFDFVSFTLWFALLLLVAFVGGDLVLRWQLTELDKEVRTSEQRLEQIGEYCARLAVLDEQIKNDKMLDRASQPMTYFQELATLAGLQDFNIRPDDQRSRNTGYQDFVYRISARNRPVSRRNIVQFLQQAEANSQRVRTLHVQLGLEERDPTKDLWNWEVSFLRREPVLAASAPN